MTERQRYILRVRTMAKAVAEAYYQAREAWASQCASEVETNEF